MYIYIYMQYICTSRENKSHLHRLHNALVVSNFVHISAEIAFGPWRATEVQTPLLAKTQNGARRKSDILKGSKGLEKSTVWLYIRTLIQPHVRTKMHARTSLLHPGPTSLTTSSTPLMYRLALD